MVLRKEAIKCSPNWGNEKGGNVNSAYRFNRLDFGTGLLTKLKVEIVEWSRGGKEKQEARAAKTSCSRAANTWGVVSRSQGGRESAIRVQPIWRQPAFHTSLVTRSKKCWKIPLLQLLPILKHRVLCSTWNKNSQEVFSLFLLG